ncbi:Retrovirus-related Pol polyprotein from transposon TNT 1-94 [Bienertia sinuspersici]
MATKIEVTSPLYLHPSEGTGSIAVEKLEGSSNYRSWKRSMEIALCSKRKIGFVTGTEKRDNGDPVKAEAWDTCNSMVISWLLASVTDQIKRAVMFTGTAEDIWKQLEATYSVANGSRKYQLCKAMYELKQNNKKIADYYTDFKCLWEEFDALKDYPPITRMNNEMTAYISAVKKEEDEQKLFQFLNGLKEQYATLRSQILMMSPLPTVNTVCGMLQQEESQNEVFYSSKEENEKGFAMMGKKSDLICSNCSKRGHTQESCWACTVCGKNGHATENCWYLKGFPPKRQQNNKEFKDKGKGSNSKPQIGRESNRTGGSKWQKGKEKFSANICTQSEGNGITAQQLEQLLKVLPLPSKTEEDSGEDAEANFVEVAQCNMVQAKTKEWVIDSGATHHMSGCEDHLRDMKLTEYRANIHLPNGEKSLVTHTGPVKLKAGITLGEVMYAPNFTHNLISVHKLTKDENCKVVFHLKFCLIQNSDNNEVIAVGKEEKGVYYLINETVNKVVTSLKEAAHRKMLNLEGTESKFSGNSELNIPQTVEKTKYKKESANLWHKRLGHAPIHRIKKIEEFKNLKTEKDDDCLICPAAKFTKQSFEVSSSRAKEAFELIHLDTWGPYRIQSRQGYRYFLTIVDDYSRTTWVHLMKTKDEAPDIIEKFINMASTQFGNRVKKIRSDNALEFEDKQCRHIFQKQGINHETSCVDTPQQNGRVERKHRSLLKWEEP